MAGQVKILWDDSVAAYRVASPYNPNFVELLKKLIPISDRVWDSSTKIWTVTEQYGDPIKNMCEQVYGAGNVTFVSKLEAAQVAAARAHAAQQAAMNAQQQAAAQAAAYANAYVPPQPRRGEPLDVVMLVFCKVLPYEAARAAYRAAALALHPDKNGGDGSRMSALNAAWTRIETEFYGKAK